MCSKRQQQIEQQPLCVVGVWNRNLPFEPLAKPTQVYQSYYVMEI